MVYTDSVKIVFDIYTEADRNHISALKDQALRGFIWCHSPTPDILNQTWYSGWEIEKPAGRYRQAHGTIQID